MAHPIIKPLHLCSKELKRYAAEICHEHRREGQSTVAIPKVTQGSDTDDCRLKVIKGCQEADFCPDDPLDDSALVGREARAHGSGRTSRTLEALEVR